MATEGVMLRDGSNTTAAADLSAKQFFGVKLTASRAVNLVAASTDIPYGVLQNKPTSGQAADVCLFGITKVVAGGTIAAGAKIMFNTSGQAIAWASGAGNTVAGYAVVAMVSGDVGTMFLHFDPVALT